MQSAQKVVSDSPWLVDFGIGLVNTVQVNYSLSQNCWDTFVSPCPLNVGVQGLVTEPR